METATEFVCKEIRKKMLSQTALSILGVLIFLTVAVLCLVAVIASLLGLIESLGLAGYVGLILVLLFSLLILFVQMKSFKKSVKQYSNPLETETIQRAFRAGVHCEDIYKTLTDPVDMVLGICIGEKCLGVVDNIVKTFALVNVSEIYMTIHTTNGVEDKYGITVVDKSGEKIIEWKEAEAFSRKKIKLEVTEMIHTLAGYCPNAKIGYSK